MNGKLNNANGALKARQWGEEIKTIIIVYFSFNGYQPTPIIFDDRWACDQVQESLERLADKAGSPTPQQIYLRGHRDTPYFIPCEDYQ